MRKPLTELGWTTRLKLLRCNDFRDLLCYRIPDLGLTEVVEAERDPQGRGHQPPPELQCHRVGGRQPCLAFVGVAGAHLVQEPFHPRKALLEFFDGKSVERRTHHDAGLKFVRGLQLLHRRPGITQRRPGIGEMLQSRCQQLAFAPEMAMQQAVVHPGPCGDLTNRCGSRTLLRE
jgi:hypothetical protein